MKLISIVRKQLNKTVKTFNHFFRPETFKLPGIFTPLPGVLRIENQIYIIKSIVPQGNNLILKRN